MYWRIFRFISGLLLTGVLIAACGPCPNQNVVQSERKRELRPAPSQQDFSRLVDGNNAFALEMYQSLRGQPGNLVFSPYSISLALAMTYAGARADTEAQMRETLHFGPEQSETHTAFNALDLALQDTAPAGKPDNEAEPLELRIANAVWAERNSTFLPEYLDTLAINYGAGMHPADFISNYNSVRHEVNDWVEDQTEKKIRNLIPEGTFNTDTRMALVNAIYFKGDWLYQFSANSTHDAPFLLLDGTQISIPTMSEGMFVPYTSGDGWQMVELPYAGETASMLILVPDKDRFEEIETGLDAEILKQMTLSLQPSNLELSLPKFKFESSFGLAGQLSYLGMPDAFDRGRADFSGITGKKDLFISAVVHKAFIAVDEEGTEAAAATIVILQGVGAMQYPVNLHVDRPFIFAIRNRATGQILFLGRVVDPR